jgi:tetratricopeptide (TPR) repeat protein
MLDHLVIFKKRFALMRFFVLCLLGAYLLLLSPLQRQLKERAVAVKLGYTPVAEALKMTSADHRYALAGWTVLKVLFYYGTTIDKAREHVVVSPEYYNMYKTLETVVKLDPYNMDAYYFAESAFTWELGRISDVNRMLDYGMKYRTWDWYLPFFAGFNEAYFLKDYAKAGRYMQKAAEISGDPLFTRLASRYFYESGRTQLGLAFLDTVIKSTRDRQVREVYLLRRQALAAVQEIEAAIHKFQKLFARDPQTIAELVAVNILEAIPEDPYGGDFYIDQQGKVRSTSKFAFLPGRKTPSARQPGEGEGLLGNPLRSVNPQ